MTAPEDPAARADAGADPAEALRAATRAALADLNPEPQETMLFTLHAAEAGAPAHVRLYYDTVLADALYHGLKTTGGSFLQVVDLLRNLWEQARVVGFPPVLGDPDTGRPLEDDEDLFRPPFDGYRFHGYAVTLPSRLVLAYDRTGTAWRRANDSIVYRPAASVAEVPELRARLGLLSSLSKLVAAVAAPAGGPVPVLDPTGGNTA